MRPGVREGLPPPLGVPLRPQPASLLEAVPGPDHLGGHPAVLGHEPVEVLHAPAHAGAECPHDLVSRAASAPHHAERLHDALVLGLVRLPRHIAVPHEVDHPVPEGRQALYDVRPHAQGPVEEVVEVQARPRADYVGRPRRALELVHLVEELVDPDRPGGAVSAGLGLDVVEVERDGEQLVRHVHARRDAGVADRREQVCHRGRGGRGVDRQDGVDAREVVGHQVPLRVLRAVLSLPDADHDRRVRPPLVAMGGGTGATGRGQAPLREEVAVELVRPRLRVPRRQPLGQHVRHCRKPPIRREKKEAKKRDRPPARPVRGTTARQAAMTVPRDRPPGLRIVENQRAVYDDPIPHGPPGEAARGFKHQTRGDGKTSTPPYIINRFIVPYSLRAKVGRIFFRQRGRKNKYPPYIINRFIVPYSLRAKVGRIFFCARERPLPGRPGRGLEVKFWKLGPARRHPTWSHQSVSRSK